jgi:hypothetical protein
VGIAGNLHPNVVLTALKPGRGKATILRAYEAIGQATPRVIIKLRTKSPPLTQRTLLEDSGHKLKIRGDTVEFDLRAFRDQDHQTGTRPTEEGRLNPVKAWSSTKDRRPLLRDKPTRDALHLFPSGVSQQFDCRLALARQIPLRGTEELSTTALMNPPTAAPAVSSRLGVF